MIATFRLELVPSSVRSLQCAMAGNDALAATLGVAVPPTWPPDHLDTPVLEFLLSRLTEHPAEAGWWLHFAIARPSASRGRTLIGTAGYKGLPSSDGVVEIGYSIVSDERRRGYATEAARALVTHAFSLPEVEAVIAHTLPDLVPSIGVLTKCGFRFVGEGSEPGTIQYRIDRRPQSM